MPKKSTNKKHTSQLHDRLKGLEMQKFRNLGVSVTVSEAGILRVLAKENNVSVSALIRHCIRNYLEIE